MRLAPLIVTLCLSLPASADCAEDIAALFSGGPLDPFVRPNRQEITVQIAPDGSETTIATVYWDGPVKSVNCTAALCALYVGSEMWTAPGPTGPWTSAPSQLPDNPEAFARATNDSLAANVSEPECLGAATLGDRPVTRYRYRSQTDPNEFGSWWGARYTAFIDAETGQLIRLEEAQGIASWAPAPSDKVKITTVTYSDEIKITRPAE